LNQPPKFDEKTARRVEDVYSSVDEEDQRNFVMNALGASPGERIIDIGSGPGYVLRDIAGAVGPAGRAVGVDPSEAMIDLARKRCAGLKQVALSEGDALALPADEGEFDAAVITQVYEYVADIAAALSELRRVLRPGGRAVILDTDWDSLVWSARDGERAARILKAWDSHLADPHLPRTLSARLRGAGFEVERRDVFPFLNAEYDPECYSCRMLNIIVPFVIRYGDLPKQEVKAWAGELEELGREGKYFFSLNRYLFVCRNPAEA
jgi:ubiquinone/menaquinone biosynthesis C-methylase UbiE